MICISDIAPCSVVYPTSNEGPRLKVVTLPPALLPNTPF